MKNSQQLNSSYIILCGVFKYQYSALNKKQLFEDYAPWQNRIFNGEYQNTFEYLKKTYYDNYLDNIFPETRNNKINSNNLSLNQLNHYSLKECFPNTKDKRFKELAIHTKEGDLKFSFDFIDLYLFPLNIGMFAIKTELAGENIDINQLSAFSNAIRFLNTELHFSDKQHVLFKDLIQKEILNPIGISQESWINYNPQLKSYINIDLKSPISKEKLDYLLYDIGNLSPLGSSEGIGMFSPTPEYFAQQMKNHKIAIFNNWSALILYDTFTRISSNFPDSFKSWEIDYFNIYVYSLFKKFYMYFTNTELSNITTISKETKVLRNKFIEFINDYHHSHISYKFLPDIIREKLNIALEITDEIESMEIKINRINTHYQEYREGTNNTILLILAMVSVLGVAVSISQWMESSGIQKDKIYPWYSIILTTSIFILVITIFIINNIRRRKNLIN
jgi:uncharacterized membrane protein YidH (DUF202 family)